MKHSILSLLLILFLSLPSFAGKEIKYAAFSIPEALTENADAVIREYNVVKHIISKTKVITEETFVVTIYNKKAQYLGYFNESYDPLNSISKYELVYYNAMGLETEKAKKSDFKDFAGYDGFSLYDDQRVIYYKAMASNYPYTIAYKLTHTSNQSLFLGNWFPVNNYNVALEHASLEVISDDTLCYRHLASNMPTSSTKEIIDGKIHVKWELDNFEAIDYEPYSPEFSLIAPSVRLAPNEFDYDGHKGDFTSWNSFGIWIWDLIKDKDQLDEETLIKIDELIANCTNDSDKIEVLYKYLQDNTRYVNVSLGIGGFQPFSAETVDENKYGDCKALSNYMRSLLKHAGIPSNYIVIRSGVDEHIIPEFPSQQMNHIILCVPNKGDSIWLECTSQKIPFGYISKSNHNKTVLLISENGGELVKTPNYTKEQNIQSGVSYAKLDSLGNIMLRSNYSFKSVTYESIREYFYLSKEEQKEELYKELEIPRLKIDDFEFSCINKPIPEAHCSMDLTIDKYAKHSGSRVFLTPNVLSQSTYVPEKIKDRKLAIQKSFNFQDFDTVSIDIPTNLQVEYLPENITIENEYGNYNCSFLYEDGKLLYTRHFSLGELNLPKESYNDIRNFMKQVAKADQSKVIFIKESL